MSQLSRRHLLVGLAAMPLAACGGGPAPSTYDLTAPRDGLRRSAGRRVIVVAEPTAVFALDSERIVVRAATGELTYLPKAQWADRLPRLVQSRLIQTFENTGRAAVGRPGDRLSGTYSLITDIRAFEVREATRDAYVEMACKLVSAGSGNLVTARQFSAGVPVGAIEGAGATQALDQALSRVMADITGWAQV
ncbi:MAG: ABC-type transport auxiliary lipoprotein family protein [Beijerinckiaceae bacterium]